MNPHRVFHLDLQLSVYIVENYHSIKVGGSVYVEQEIYHSVLGVDEYSVSVPY